MKNLAEAIAEKFYNEKKDLEYKRITFSKTSLAAAAWRDCPQKERLEWIEAARRVLVDKEILQILLNRAGNML